MYSVNMSIECYLLIDDNTRRIVDLHKNTVGSLRGQNPDTTHELLEEIQSEEISRRLLESAANTPSKQRHQGEEPGYRVYPEQYVSVLSGQENSWAEVLSEHQGSAIQIL